MEVFATFDIMDSKGGKVAEGHKASFCLEENQCLPGIKPFYACANFGDQGISVNCTDIYRHNIDCQWVDISEINPGMYTFKVRRLADGNSRTKSTICFFFTLFIFSSMYWYSSCLNSFPHLCVLFVCKCVMYCCHRESTQLRLNIRVHILPYLSAIYVPIVTCFLFFFHLSLPSSPRVAFLRFSFFIFFSLL
jgi:hypothetical protein